VSASRSQLLLQWTEVRIVGLDDEEGGQHVIDRIRGSAGCLVDMKVDELLNDDMTLLEISTGNLNAFVLYNRKVL
jgi:hypothetical protein